MKRLEDGKHDRREGVQSPVPSDSAIEQPNLYRDHPAVGT